MGWTVPAWTADRKWGFLLSHACMGVAALRPRRLTCGAVSGRYVNTGLVAWWRQWGFLLRSLQSSGRTVTTCTAFFIWLQRCQPPLNAVLLFKIQRLCRGTMDVTKLRRYKREDDIFNSISPSASSVARGHVVNGGHQRTDIPQRLPWTRRLHAIGHIVWCYTTMYRQCASALVRLFAEPLLIAKIR